MTTEPLTSFQQSVHGLTAAQLLHALPQAALVLLVESGSVVLFNVAAERLLGRSASDVLGQPAEWLFAGLHAAAREVHRAADATAGPRRLRVQRADGVLEVEVVLSALAGDHPESGVL